jgi:hypothetical protein
MGLVDLTLRGQLRTVVCEEYSEQARRFGCTNFVPPGLRSFLNRFLRDAGALSIAVDYSCGKIVNTMSKSVPESHYERQTGENLDRALSDMLYALRKPLKLTATLKRRALKNRAGEKSMFVEHRPATASLKGG